MSVLNTSDMEGAKKLYGDVFGWNADAMGEMALWRLPGYVGGRPEQPVPRDVVGVMARTSKDQSRDSAQSHWSVDFWTRDVDATADKAVELGGRVVVPPFDSPFSRDAVLVDPQGAVFSVSKVKALRTHLGDVVSGELSRKP